MRAAAGPSPAWEAAAADDETDENDACFAWRPRGA